MKLEDMDDGDLGKMVKDRHTRLAAAYDGGFHDTHPSDQWNADSKVLRDHRAASLPGNVASSKEIELHGGAEDDPTPHTPGTPKPPVRRGTSLAAMDRIIPGYSRVGNRHHENTVDEDGIVIVEPVGGQRS